ncbi:winged helix-turn-helix transcriptional regulator [Salinigranum rubrum]|nr:helix-turn-helix domain-containing protein [Salinigranum rubrum]
MNANARPADITHETRASLYDHLRAKPGTYLAALSDVAAIDAPRPTVRYHLKVLERRGLVTSEKRRGKRRFFPVGTAPDALELAMESAPARAVLEALAESADTVSGLAERVDRDPSTVTYHLSRLEDDGLVNRERQGQAVVNRLTPGARTVLGQGPLTSAEERAAASN